PSPADTVYYRGPIHTGKAHLLGIPHASATPATIRHPAPEPSALAMPRATAGPHPHTPATPPNYESDGDRRCDHKVPRSASPPKTPPGPHSASPHRKAPSKPGSLASGTCNPNAAHRSDAA